MSDSDLHRLLKRQLKRLSLDASHLPANQQQWADLLGNINRTYQQADQDRYTLERSLTISSQEMQTLYAEIKHSAQSELEQERRFLRAAINGITDNFVYKDAEGVYQLCNHAFEKYIGLTEQELIGRTVHGILPQQTADAIAQHDAQVLTSGAPAVFEYEDTERGMTMETHKYPLFDDDKKILGIIIISRDITQRKQVEAQLGLLAQVFARSGESIFITDADNTIMAVNQAFTDTLGYTETEVVGKNPSILKSGRDNHVYEDMLQAINSKGEWQGEIWNRSKYGALVPGWLTITRVNDNEERLTNYIGIFTDITDIKRSQERIDHLAHHDALTGLPNRLLFSDRLENAIQLAKRESRQLALLFIDLDRFKNINDTLGHPAGDEILQVVAKRLLENVRASDTVARMGGDEYLVLLPDITDSEDAAVVAHGILQALEKPITIESHEIVITCSVGISIYPRDAENITALIKHADTALYRVKEEGRNSYQYYSTDMTDKAFEHFALEASLRRALEREEFVLHYQPQFELSSQTMVGVEALIRWRHPDLGLQRPSRFIHLAEEAGLIIDIGLWAFNQACLQLYAWHNTDYPDMTIAVNVSMKQIQHPALVDSFANILKKTQASAKHLKIEITENSFMDQPEQAMQTIRELRQLGLKISIDDFGTGYSSLKYLQKLHVDELKIDRSFIHAMNSSQSNKTIVTTIINMGVSMGMRVIAEGVEDDVQRQTLESVGCNYVQGFLFGYAEPTHIFTKKHAIVLSSS